MYEAFFGLSALPFSMSPDPHFLWPSETHEEGLAVLRYGITHRKGFVLLTGEVGTGKTTLLRATLEDLVDDVDVALVVNTAEMSPLDLLKLVATEYGVSGPFHSKADYVIALNRFLLEKLASGLNTVLIIDEAQNLGDAALEEVRLLSNLETESEKLLQIVLTGQPELRSKLAVPNLRQLRQRIALEYHLEPLRPQEVRGYLEHRLQRAGGQLETVFAPGAESIFASFSHGCPRLINLLADRALLSAFTKRLRPIPLSLLEAKAKDLAAASESARPGFRDLSQG